DLVLVRASPGEPVLPRDLHRPLVGLRPRHREHRVAQVARGERRELGRELGGGPVRELARGRVVGQLDGLLGDRLGDLAPPVPHVHDGQAREAVHQLLALLRPDPYPLGAIDDQLVVLEKRVVLSLVRPEMADVVGVGGHASHTRLRGGSGQAKNCAWGGAQFRNVTWAVSRSYMAPAIRSAPDFSRSASTALRRRMSATVISTFFRATASTNS